MKIAKIWFPLKFSVIQYLCVKMKTQPPHTIWEYFFPLYTRFTSFEQLLFILIAYIHNSSSSKKQQALAVYLGYLPSFHQKLNRVITPTVLLRRQTYCTSFMLDCTLPECTSAQIVWQMILFSRYNYEWYCCCCSIYRDAERVPFGSNRLLWISSTSELLKTWRKL